MDAAATVVNIKNSKYNSFYINLPKSSNRTDFTTFAIQIYIGSDMLCLNIQVFRYIRKRYIPLNPHYLAKYNNVCLFVRPSFQSPVCLHQTISATTHPLRSYFQGIFPLCQLLFNFISISFLLPGCLLQVNL